MVVNADYLCANLPESPGRTAFVGNPPYVRHHSLTPETKDVASRIAGKLRVPVSRLAGLHVYFFMATALKARQGDIGCLITSSEWMDVNYGATLRTLLTDGLGLTSMHVFHPSSTPFADAMATGVISCFEVGSVSEHISTETLREPPDDLGRDLANKIARAELESADRWSPLVTSRTTREADGTGRLGHIASVHRGVATGANGFFLMDKSRAAVLGIERWCVPAISSAKEVFESAGTVRNTDESRLLLDLPPDIDRSAHPQLDAYLALGERDASAGGTIAGRYLCRTRTPWWSIRAPKPAPIVATYMARQAPKFALNPDGMKCTNVVHGVYPKRRMSDRELRELVNRLNAARLQFSGLGRTYHGGLEKFEPREMENLPVPAV